MVDNLAEVIGGGGLEALVRNNRLLRNAYQVDHKTYGFALAIARNDAGDRCDPGVLLRARNESRIATLLDGARNRRLRQLRGQVRTLKAELERETARVAELERELEAYRQFAQGD
jgi:hypothetical protein